VTLERFNATTALRSLVRNTTRRSQLPHLDSLVQAARHKVLSVGREGYTIHTILVSFRSLEPLDEEAVGDVPDSNALVQRAGGNILRVWRNGNGGDSILDAKCQDARAALNVPKPDGPVTAT